MIKAIIFDLDNTLIDFMTMKKMSCDAAMTAMIGAGLDVDKQKGMKILFELYNKYGMEEKTIFQKFLKKKSIILDFENTLIDFMTMKKMSCDAAMTAMIGVGLDVDKQKGIKILF